MKVKAAAELQRFFGTVPFTFEMDYIQAETFDENGEPTRYMADVQGYGTVSS
ncbi:hypothetical protein AB0M54_45865 [Actinoplanes sp. NPDC051470]|uniref:hypothetical protein n=1 Tax=Actinoplanes sp. NPDC051470 TaxID=3157224 RepID=UPI0034346FFC